MAEPLILIHGDDPSRVTHLATRLRDELGDPSASELAREEFRASPDLDAIARSLQTPPFLATRRLVLLWDPPQLQGGARSARELERLEAVLATRLETTAVLVVVRSLLSPSSPLIRAVRKLGGEVRSQPRLRGQELSRYVQERINERGLHLDRAVVARLMEAAGQDLGSLDQDLEKLQLFAPGGEPIADRDGLQLVPAAPPSELYRLTDALFDSPGRVGERLADLAHHPNIQTTWVVGALARVLRDLISLADPRDRERWGSTPDWRISRMRHHLARAGEPRLRRWLVQLADLDWEIRTGAIDPELGLELTLARMAAELGASTRG